MSVAPSPSPRAKRARKKAGAFDLGAAVGIVATNSIEFVEATFKAYDEGRCLVALRSASDEERIGLGGGLEVIQPGSSTGWARSRFTPVPSDAVCQIVFTSGTTGTPKAIALTRANVADATRRLVAAMELTAEVREYVGAPVHYSFGLGRCRAVSAAGGEYYLPPRGFDPLEIVAMLKAGEINAISAVPTLWRLVLQNADLFGVHGRAVRWIEVGSQPMSRQEKEGLKALFPQALVILQHYGLTEASRTTFLRIDLEAGEALSSVGRAADGVEVKLDAEGRVMIRGAHVAPWTLGPDGLVPLTDRDGWLTTNDLGSIRDGLLFYEGRADDLINCAGVKASPEAIETQLHAALGTTGADLAVSKAPDPLRGEGVLVSFVPRAGLTREAVVAAAALAAEAVGISAAAAVKVQSVTDIPHTETGKVRRGALIDLYVDDGASPEAAPAPASEASGLEAQLLAIWREALGRDDVSIDQGFYDVGGNSLSAVTVALGMERAGFPPELAHGIFDGKTIAQLCREMSPPPLVDGDLEARLLEIWREALGREDVSVDQGFYDVGGDSLSAVTVALGMERAGFAPELAHGIFDGRTIAQLAREAALRGPDTTEAETAPTPQVKTEVARLSEASNFIKGIVFLCMISSHWMPVYLLQIGHRQGIPGAVLAPIFSLGSPTLAFAFGLGVAVFHLRQQETSPAAFRRNIKTSALLLALGIAVGGISEVGSIAAVGGGMTVEQALLRTFTQGPFLYYFLAAVSLPLWVKRLRRDRASILAVFLAALASYGVYVGLKTILPLGDPDEPLGGLAEVLVGHWSLFQMSAITLTEVGAGLAIEAHIRDQGRLSAFLPVGLLMAGGGLVMSGADRTFDSWFVFPKLITLPSVFFYAGLAVILIASFEKLAAAVAGKPLLRGSIDLVCCLGILLFPLYVAQSVVYHGAAVASHFSGLPLYLPLTLMIAGFVAIVAFPVWRVYRLYYAGRR